MQLSAETLARMSDLLDRVEDGSTLHLRVRELQQMEEELRGLLDHDVDRWLATIPQLASEAASSLYSAGGKRLRPVLALACGGAAGGDPRRALPVAAAVELLHTGTLLHDDVVDEGELRRGRPTARRVWGNALAVLAGDFCYFAALDALLDHGDNDILKRAMRVARLLSEGELIQLQRRGRATLDGESEYFRIIDRKTASLFAFATWGGARCAGGSEEQAAALDTYGRSLGLAFQVVDDILDFTADPEVFGKALGHDVAEGTVTLPLAYAMEADAALSADAQRLVSDFAEGREPTVDPASIVRRVCESGAIERAKARADELTREALSALEPLHPSRYRDALGVLAASMLERAS